MVRLSPKRGAVGPLRLHRPRGFEIVRELVEEQADCLRGLRDFLERVLIHRHPVHTSMFGNDTRYQCTLNPSLPASASGGFKVLTALKEISLHGSSRLGLHLYSR